MKSTRSIFAGSARKTLFVLLLVIPVLVLAQDNKKPKSSPPPAKPSAPAPHASAPVHNSGPSQQHSTAAPTAHQAPGNTAHPNAMGGANNNRGGVNNIGHPASNMAPHAGPNANGGHTAPGRQVALRGGGSANIRSNGQIRSVDRNGMHIEHGIHGGRTVVSTHNGARVVTTGRRGGYVQRAYFARGGRTYVSRTYVVNNVTYTSVYRSYSYGGYCCYYGYTPAYYYAPVYYGWAYNPWPAPAYYSWGWGPAPWYGYYGPYYYQPYPVYPAAYFWVTDWMIAASLQAAYEAQATAWLNPEHPNWPLVASLSGAIPAPEEAKVVLSKEVKDQLAEEVKAQMAEDQTAASKTGDSSSASPGDAPPPALDPKRRVFVAHDEISVVSDGDECSLSDGDVISRVSDTSDADKNVQVKVLASKKNDCAVGKQFPVALEDLQEMHNHFREQLTSGMDELAKKQGTAGLPKAPDTSKKDGEVPAPPPDSSAAKTLKDQQAAADQTEADVKQEASSSGGGAQ